MKRVLVILSLGVAVFSTSLAPASAGKDDILGIKIGMARDEVLAMHSSCAEHGFSRKDDALRQPVYLCQVDVNKALSMETLMIYLTSSASGNKVYRVDYCFYDEAYSKNPVEADKQTIAAISAQFGVQPASGGYFATVWDLGSAGELRYQGYDGDCGRAVLRLSDMVLKDADDRERENKKQVAPAPQF